MTIHVIGLGDTAKEFKPDGNITIGVNDVKGCDYQVCVDRPRSFNHLRFLTIRHLKPNIFFSHLDDWNFMPHFEKINLKNIHAHNDRWSEFIPSSNNSPFVACGIAKHIFGATEIKLWGVDFNTHPNIKDEMREQAVRDYKLFNKKYGNIIKPHSGSYLHNKI